MQVFTSAAGSRASMEIAAVEYGYTIFYFDQMLRAGAVDVLEADATRCGGISGIIQGDARCISLSRHTAAAVHLPAACALNRICHLEYFCDHARMEQMLFAGAIEPVQGNLAPDPSRPGLGIELKREVAERFRA